MKYKKNIFYAFLIWTSWLIFYAVIMYFQVPEIPALGALISSMTSHYVYAVLSIPIWFLCKRIHFENISRIAFIVSHFFLGNLFSALWLFLTYGIWYLSTGKEIFDLVHFEQIVGWQYLSGITTYFLVSGIFYTIIYYRRFRDKELKEAELKVLTKEAELKALKMQINPHFLFNSLNSINALIKHSPDQARKMMSLLSDLLRFSLETKEESKIPLKQELEIMHRYLNIERIRFRDRMEVHEEIEQGIDIYKVPAMLLQPLLENSIKHGISSHREKGWISVKLSKHNNNIRISVSNSMGNPANEVQNKKNGLSTGLQNIRKRLNLIYGSRCKFTVNGPKPDIFKVEITIPAEQV